MPLLPCPPRPPLTVFSPSSILKFSKFITTNSILTFHTAVRGTFILLYFPFLLILFLLWLPATYYFFCYHSSSSSQILLGLVTHYTKTAKIVKMKFTDQQKIWIIEKYAASSSPSAVRRSFLIKHGIVRRKKADHTLKDFSLVFKHFKEFGSVKRSPGSRKNRQNTSPVERSGANQM